MSKPKDQILYLFDQQQNVLSILKKLQLTFMTYLIKCISGFKKFNVCYITSVLASGLKKISYLKIRTSFGIDGPYQKSLKSAREGSLLLVNISQVLPMLTFEGLYHKLLITINHYLKKISNLF